MPLLVIEGEKGMNSVLAIQAALISDHVKALKFASGHWLMEEKPAEIHVCSDEVKNTLADQSIQTRPLTPLLSL